MSLTYPPDAFYIEDITDSCPACGQYIDYCQGHGETGDPQGHAILVNHDEGMHEACHPDGCEQAPQS